MRTYQLIRSDRRTVALELRPDGTLWVRVPRHLSRVAIDHLVAEREEWIVRHLATLPSPRPQWDEATLQTLRERAQRELPPRVAYYAAQMGLQPAAVKINAAATRWGSCSAAGNLNFSCRLAAYPAEAVDAVVVHELAHLRHMNHGKEFYALVEQVLPDYRARMALLRRPPTRVENG